MSAANNKDQIRRRVLLGVAATCMALGLSGCFINRAIEVQDQMCDYDSNFSLQFGDSANFNFHSRCCWTGISCGLQVHHLQR